MNFRDFLSGPVVKTPCFQCRGHRFDPWLGNQDSSCHRWGLTKKRKESIYNCSLCRRVWSLGKGEQNQEIWNYPLDELNFQPKIQHIWPCDALPDNSTLKYVFPLQFFWIILRIKSRCSYLPLYLSATEPFLVWQTVRKWLLSQPIIKQ